MRSAPLLLLAALVACGDAMDGSLPMEAASRDINYPPNAGPRARVADAVERTSISVMQTDRRLIRQAEIRVEVEDVSRTIAIADSVARKHGAIMVDVSVHFYERHGTSGRFVIRVPSTQFSATLAALKRLGDVEHEVVKAEDVTKAYADVETRITVKEQTVARLRTLLATRTGDLEDVLNVERELARVVTELEQLKGERRYFDERVAESTIIVDLAQRVPGGPVDVVRPITLAFAKSVELFAQSVAALIAAAAFAMPWLIVATLAWRIRGRMRSRRPPVAPATP